MSAKQRTVQELLSSISASRLSTWMQCRLKFWFQYLSGIQKPKSAALHLGTVVHSTLKFWNKARWRQETPDITTLHGVYAALWSAEQANAPVDWLGEEDAQKQLGWRLLETYFRESPIRPEEKPEAVEVTVETDLTNHGLPKLVGVLDLVRPNGKIVDFKTTGKTPDPEKVVHLTETQTTAYAVLYRDAVQKKESAIEIHSLVKLKYPKISISVFPPIVEQQRTRLFRMLGSYVEGLQRQDFVPSPGMNCCCCEFFNECRRWG